MQFCTRSSLFSETLSQEILCSHSAIQHSLLTKITYPYVHTILTRLLRFFFFYCNILFAMPSQRSVVRVHAFRSQTSAATFLVFSSSKHIQIVQFLFQMALFSPKILMGTISGPQKAPLRRFPGSQMFWYIYYLKKCLISIIGDLAQMVERSLSMREALGSMPRFSNLLFCRSHHQ